MEPFLAPTLSVAGNSCGREEAIMTGRCLPPSLGCGRNITQEEFNAWPDLDRREYQISGWCRDCQNKVFRDPDTCCCIDPCTEVDVGVGIMTCATVHCTCSDNDDEEFFDRIYEHDMEDYYGNV